MTEPSTGMAAAARGFVHVRRLYVAMGVVAVVLGLVVVFPEISLGLRLHTSRPPRGIGTPEIAALLMAALIVPLTMPEFDCRERLSYGAARLAHTLTTLVVALVPLLVLPVWALALAVDPPAAYHPPVVLLTGNVVTMSAAPVLGVLLLGRGLGAAVGIIAAVAIPFGQQIWPHSLFTEFWATGTEWHTHWPLTILLLALTAVVAHRRHSVPPA